MKLIHQIAQDSLFCFTYFFFKFFTALQLFVFLPISFYLAAMQPNGHGFMVKVQILNSVFFLKLTLFT